MLKKKLIECPYLNECSLAVTKEKFEECCKIITRQIIAPYKFCWKYLDIIEKKKERKLPKNW